MNPTHWARVNGADWKDESGNITETALGWLRELGKLTRNQIDYGFEMLRSRKNPTYALSAFEFSAHCVSVGADAVWEEISRFLDRGPNSDFWWQTVEAYTTFKMLRYDRFRNESSAALEKRVKKIYATIRKGDLLVVPLKPVAIEKKEKPALTAAQKAKNAFRVNVMCWASCKDHDLVGDSALAEMFTDADKCAVMTVKWTQAGKPEIGEFLGGEGLV